VIEMAPDAATARGWFNVMAKGGSMIAAFGPDFLTSAFGMFKDRFGTLWIVSTCPEGH